MLEHTVETHLVSQCRRAGLLCLKLTSPARAGVPDRIVITPAATVFVEVKRPGGRLRRLQQVVIDKMRGAGATVHVVDSIASVDELVGELSEGRPRQKLPVPQQKTKAVDRGVPSRVSRCARKLLSAKRLERRGKDRANQQYPCTQVLRTARGSV